jgi:hypothetical protein
MSTGDFGISVFSNIKEGMLITTTAGGFGYHLEFGGYWGRKCGYHYHSGFCAIIAVAVFSRIINALVLIAGRSKKLSVSEGRFTALSCSLNFFSVFDILSSNESRGFYSRFGRHDASAESFSYIRVVAPRGGAVFV